MREKKMVKGSNSCNHNVIKVGRVILVEQLWRTTWLISPVFVRPQADLKTTTQHHTCLQEFALKSTHRVRAYIHPSSLTYIISFTVLFCPLGNALSPGKFGTLSWHRVSYLHTHTLTHTHKKLTSVQDGIYAMRTVQNYSLKKFPQCCL